MTEHRCCSAVVGWSHAWQGHIRTRTGRWWAAVDNTAEHSSGEELSFFTYFEQRQRPFNGLWSGTTRVGRYQKEHSPTHTHPDHRASFIIFLLLQRSMASSLFNLRAWQSSRTTSFQVFFGLPLGLGPSTWCSIHFFTQSSYFEHCDKSHVSSDIQKWQTAAC